LAAIRSCDNDPSRCQYSKGREAGDEEVVATPCGDETGNIAAQEGRALYSLIAGDHHAALCVLSITTLKTTIKWRDVIVLVGRNDAAISISVSRNRISIVALSKLVATIDPLALHEFELMLYAGVENLKNDTTWPLVSLNWRVSRQIFSVRYAAAD